MNADDIKRMQRLRRSDPREVGGYTLLGRLGTGGMGVVYLARAAGRRLVAVKIVHAELANDEEFRGRFRSEVERARQVPPFCTAEVLDADANHNPPYLVVEYVDGPSLGEVVEDRGPLTPSNVHAVAVGVASALSAIHGAGVIHRDLKPRNVLLAPGSPKVIDFGIARAFESTSQHTRTGQLVGTVAYMAPERFSAEPGTPLTPAADIFAWGAVVAFAATGRTPFDGDSPPVTAARILTGVPNLNGLTDPLLRLVELALAKDPEDRPTARELLDLLLSSGAPVIGHAPARRSPAAGHTGGHAPASVAATTASGRHPGHDRPQRHYEHEYEQFERHRPRRQVRPDAFSSPPARYDAETWVPAPVPPPRAAPSRTAGPRVHRARAPRSRAATLLPVAALVLLITALMIGGIAMLRDKREGTAATTLSAGSPPARPTRTVLVSDLNRKCLDVVDATIVADQPVQMWVCSAEPNQVWRWAPDGSLRSANLCLAVDKPVQDGAPVRLATCDGSPEQQWTFTAGRDVVNPAADKCLDIRNRDALDRAPLQLWACGGTANQKWTLPGLTAPPS
jgi:predicted Ser/Thr protein kinase